MWIKNQTTKYTKFAIALSNWKETCKLLEHNTCCHIIRRHVYWINAMQNTFAPQFNDQKWANSNRRVHISTTNILINLELCMTRKVPRVLCMSLKSRFLCIHMYFARALGDILRHSHKSSITWRKLFCMVIHYTHRKNIIKAHIWNASSDDIKTVALDSRGGVG